jgi:hypothetical protein
VDFAKIDKIPLIGIGTDIEIAHRFYTSIDIDYSQWISAKNG